MKRNHKPQRATEAMKANGERLSHRTSHIKHRTSRRCRGAAMSEMVLAMPFIIVIFVFLLYFGKSMVRVQHVHVMDRYEAWRQASKNAPGPSPQIDHGHILLNETFFGGRAASIGYDAGNWFPMDAPDELIARTDSRSDKAGDLADDMIAQSPRGRSVAFSVEHTETNRLVAQFQGPVRHRHTRFGDDWRFANNWRKDEDGDWHPARGGVDILGSLRDTFYPTFDDDLHDLEDGDNGLAAALRRMYLAEPGYDGPTVWREFRP